MGPSGSGKTSLLNALASKVRARDELGSGSGLGLRSGSRSGLLTSTKTVNHRPRVRIWVVKGGTRASDSECQAPQLRDKIIEDSRLHPGKNLEAGPNPSRP